MYRCATMLGLATALCGFGLWCPVQAEDVKDKDADKHDAKFIMEAGSGGMLEVKLGKLATERATNADVRKFGERMVTDHTKAGKELMAIADKKGVKFPTELMRKDQETYDKFKDMKAAEFDREYIKGMVKDHEEDAEAFTKEAKNGNDDDVKAFAEKTLPVVKEHLKLAKDIAAKMESKDK